MPTNKIMKFIMHFESRDDRARMIAILEQYKNEFEISSSADTNIEIMPHNVNKGSALLRLCSFLNIDIKDTMPIGDEKNDISMLSLSPNSVTFAASAESVRRASGHVLDAEASAIVGEAICKFALRDK
jgi:hydroxymethylpyrimidine pyrophosphatase-like HAD family hydrolase